MAFIDNKDLKKLFAKESDWKNFAQALESIKTFYMDNYDFLNLKEDVWTELILGCALKKAKDPNRIRATRTLIQNSVNNYIKTKINKKDFRLFNRLLNILRRQNKTIYDVLEAFFEKLKCFNIQMTENMFQDFKQGCSVLKDMLKRLNIEGYDYQWIEKYVSPEYDLYRYLKPLNMDAQESISLIDKILGYYPKNSYKKFSQMLAFDHKNKELQKLKFLIANYLYFQKIYNVCLESIDVSLATFYNVIIKYSLDDLKKIIEQAIVYFNNKLDKSFTYKIINDSLKMCSQTVLQKAKNENSISTNGDFQMEKLYAKFPDYEGVVPEKKQETIDYLFSKRSKKTQKLIKLYLTKKLMPRSKEYNSAIYAIKAMKDEYEGSYNLTCLTPEKPETIKFSESDILRKIFSNESAFLEFASALESVKSFYVINFAFLGQSESSWDKLILECALKSVSFPDKLKATKDLINASIKKYLNNKIAKKDFRVFEKLLNDIIKQNQNEAKILEIFWEKIKGFGVLMTEDAYASFKTDCEVFKNILRNLSLENFNYQELEEYLSPANCLYRYLRSINLNVKSSRELIDKFLSFYPENSYEKFNEELKNNQNNSDLQKLKFLIFHYCNFEKLYNLCSGNTNISVEDFYKVIIGYSLDYLEEIIKNFNNMSKVFIDQIINDCLAYSRKINLEKDANAATNKEFKLEDLCLKFPDYEGVSPKKKLEVVSYLFNNRSSEVQETIQKYLAGELKTKTKEYNSAICALVFMKKRYTEIYERGMVIPKSGKTIYDKFPDYEDVSDEKKKEVVDYLFNSRTSKVQSNIKKYFAGELRPKTKEYKSATDALEYMRKKYDKIHMQGMVLSNTQETIYDKFPDYEGVSSEKKREVVDYLFNSRTSKVQSNIKKYLAGELRPKTKEYNSAISALVFMKKRYTEIYERGMVIPKSGKTIYDKFPDYEDVSDEKKKEAVDYLFNSRTSKVQSNIKKYLAGKLKPKTKEYKNAADALEYMRKKYDKIHMQDMILPEAQETLYDKFPDYEDVSDEKKKEVVDYLFNKRSSKVQTNITKYIAGELNSGSEEYQSACTAIWSMKKSYIEIHEKGIDISPVSLYDKFPDYEGISLDKKMVVVDFLFAKNSLFIKNCINKFLARELKSNTKEYKNAIVALSAMKKTYEEIQDKRNFKIPSEEYIIKLSIDLDYISEGKARLIAIELLMLEYIFMCYGFTKYQYKNYQNELLAEIKLSNPQLSKEAQIREYLRITKDYLEQDINLKEWR